jgi:hypothetical protein
MTTASTKKALARRAVRLKERVLLDERLVHPRATHGKATSYVNYGCRCAPCTAAWADHMKAKRLERAATRVEDDDGYPVAPPELKHGSASTGQNWGCKCRPCLAAMAALARRHRAARKTVSS